MKIATVTIAPAATVGVFAALGISAALGTLSLQAVPEDGSVSQANTSGGTGALFTVKDGDMPTDTSEVYLVNNGAYAASIVAR